MTKRFLNVFQVLRKMITIEDFQKMDLRTAEILSCERVPNTEKLLKMELDVGEMGKRTIVAGIADKYEPEKLLHKKIIIVANLEPRSIKGIESHGMLLATDDVALLTTMGDSENGSKVR
jgi:methionyl-tRNA synthetase